MDLLLVFLNDPPTIYVKRYFSQENTNRKITTACSPYEITLQQVLCFERLKKKIIAGFLLGRTVGSLYIARDSTH